MSSSKSFVQEFTEKSLLTERPETGGPLSLYPTGFE